MSEGFIQFTAGLSPQAPSGGDRAPSIDVRIVDVPQAVKAELYTRRAALKVQGEVIKAERDLLSIRSLQGEITVRTPEGQPIPQRGQAVEVELRHQAHAEVKQIIEQAKLRVLDTLTGVKQGQAPQVRSTATPLDVALNPQQAQAALPQAGAVLTLKPIAPQALNTLPASEPVQQVTALLTAQVQARSDVITQGLSRATPLAEFLRNAQAPVQSAIPVATTITTPSFTPSLTASAPNILPTDPQRVFPRVPAVQIESAFTPAASQLAPALSTPVSAPSAPLTQTPASPVFQNISVTFEGIEPPRVEIVSPSAPQNQSLNAQIKPPVESLILQSPKAGNIQLTVQSFTTQRLPVVSAFIPGAESEQFFTLQFPLQHVPVGSQIQVSPHSAPDATAQSLNVAIAQVQALPLPVMLTPQNHWPVLEEIAQSLNQAAPQGAQAMMASTPSPASPAQLGPAVLFFVAALRGGDMGQWLGDRTSDMLRSLGKGDAISRLSGEAPMLARASDGPITDWRSLNIPMLWQEDIQKVTLHYRHEQDDDADEIERGIKATRFVFDLALENMGTVQLDGLFRPGRLDLAVRTETPFAESSRAEMRRIYAKALKETGVTGELSFGDTLDDWVTIYADKAQALGVNI